jgi:hypothetical protein
MINPVVKMNVTLCRRLLPRLSIDQTRCARLVEALGGYAYGWNEPLRMFSKRPRHDWTSHGCDALRYFATGHTNALADYAETRPAPILSFHVYTGKRR